MINHDIWYFNSFLILSFYAISQKNVKTVGILIYNWPNLLKDKQTIAINNLVKSNMLNGYILIWQ